MMGKKKWDYFVGIIKRKSGNLKMQRENLNFIGGR